MPDLRTLQLAVCDDSQVDLEWISGTAEQILREEGHACNLTKYNGPQDLLRDITAGRQFHILLLDVVMEELTGIELARAIRQIRVDCSVIFVSSNREMALYGYEVAAARYLAKPVSEEKLREALLYCCKHTSRKNEILLPTDHGRHRISISDIEYVEAFDQGTKFVLIDETVFARMTFTEVLALLQGDEFIQCHRAFLVNMAYIKRIGTLIFEMDCGARIPVSKHRSNEVNRKLLDYLAD